MPTPHYFLPGRILRSDERLDVDVCIYGGTAAGVIAAKTAADEGLSVAILNPAFMLGGMTTGGLGWTDFGHKNVIGGRARQFYRDIGTEYGRDEEWAFEPSVAQRVIDRYAEASGATVRHGTFLASCDVDADGRITEITMLGGLRCRAKVFVDSTYEGDLMAQAGVPYSVGRESNATFGETINGVQIRHKHQFDHPVDPYIVPGDPNSGVLYGVEPRDAAPAGSGDGRVQAYNFRVCLTDDAAIRVPFAAPDGYDPAHYELAARWLATLDRLGPDDFNYSLREDGLIRKFDRLAKPHKTDTNNHGAVSSDFIGQSWTWPEAGYVERERLFQEHVRWQRGFYYFMANDERVPDHIRSAYAAWGLAGDEYAETDHWPHQLYVREARRLRGKATLTEADVTLKHVCDDPIAMGSYMMDSHNVQRIIRDGRVFNEGDVQLKGPGPYVVSQGCITPPDGSCPNLLVAVCASASHIAFGSLRMEPVFMILGESAALAASLAVKEGTSVQDVPYAKLRPKLEAAEQVIGTS
ncbi:MAG: FAD-dependent oxidoreductase [Planctomycetota bacterium]